MLATLAERTAMNCPNCSQSLKPDARFCNNCGATVDPPAGGSAPTLRVGETPPASPQWGGSDKTLVVPPGAIQSPPAGDPRTAGSPGYNPPTPQQGYGQQQPPMGSPGYNP